MTKAWLTFASVLLLSSSAACGDDTGTGSGGSGATGGASTGGASTGGSGGENTGGAGGNATTGGSGGESTGGAGGTGGAMAFSLTSSAFMEGQMFPTANVCESGGGMNQSPALTWTPGPSGTLSYAIVMRDLDFQNGFIHWVIWDIPANVTTLPANIEHEFEPAVPAGAKQARFNQNIRGYQGPCSPNSVNTYQLTVYAIDAATLQGLDQNSNKMEAAAAIEAADIALATLSGES